MSHTITLNIRYKPNTSMKRVSVEIDRDKATIEEIASLLAKKSAVMFQSYHRGKLDNKAFRKYEFGHYKLILGYLEATIK